MDAFFGAVVLRIGFASLRPLRRAFQSPSWPTGESPLAVLVPFPAPVGVGALFPYFCSSAMRFSVGFATPVGFTSFRAFSPFPSPLFFFAVLHLVARLLICCCGHSIPLSISPFLPFFERSLHGLLRVRFFASVFVLSRFLGSFGPLTMTFFPFIEWIFF